MDALAARADLDVVEGPVQRGGARGQGTSVYVRDPDGNLLELKHYG
jgi:catechol 2,3-dioxygenase-like lactoylglutathione lyase family enzyme